MITGVAFAVIVAAAWLVGGIIVMLGVVADVLGPHMRERVNRLNGWR